MAGKLQVVDGDGHLVTDIAAVASRMPQEFLNRASGSSLGNIFPPIDHLHAAQPVATPPGSFPKIGVEEWLMFMDEVGIDCAALFPTGGLSYGYIVNRDWAIAVCRAYNDWLYDTYVKSSPRFVGLALIPMQEPEEAALELRRAVEELGMAGAMLPTRGLPNHLGAKEYWPVYEEADRLGCCLAVHGGSHSGMGFDHLNVYAPVHAMGHPVGLMAAFAGVVFNGVLDHYPNARWGFLEGGVAWFMLCMERFDRSYETHVDLDPRGELLKLRDGERVSDYILRHIHDGRLFVGCEGTEPLISEALRLTGGKCFVFSSDFPHEVNADICKHELSEIFENTKITGEERTGVLSENARALYGRPVVAGLTAN